MERDGGGFGVLMAGVIASEPRAHVSLVVDGDICFSVD